MSCTLWINIRLTSFSSSNVLVSSFQRVRYRTLPVINKKRMQQHRNLILRYLRSPHRFRLWHFCLGRRITAVAALITVPRVLSDFNHINRRHISRFLTKRSYANLCHANHRNQMNRKLLKGNTMYNRFFNILEFNSSIPLLKKKILNILELNSSIQLQEKFK